jgi:predicted house-cleaning noncanonical NTP pyrophosphatase (MazG superfamily)
MGIIDELKKTKNMKELDKIMELASSYTNASNSTKRKWLRVYKTKKELLEKS